MLVGTAWEEITPDRPIALMGQLHERIATYTRDPLTTNAVVFDDGTTQVVLVSIDVCGMPSSLIEEIRTLCATRLGVDAHRIVISATHTHVAPHTSDRATGKAEPDFIQKLKDGTVQAIERALANREECTLYAGTGELAEMGWNRRGMRRNGSVHMYWGSWNEDFVGVEGPRDPEAGVVYARRADDSVKVVIPSFSTHPNSLEQGTFYSADTPGEVRRVLRGVLGSEVGVVYLTGAAGNTAPTIMGGNPEKRQPWRLESGAIRSGWYLGGEILKVMAAAIEPMTAPRLQHEWQQLDIPMREWDPYFDPEGLGQAMRDYFESSRAEWPQLQAESNPVPVRLNVVRVGDAAICFNPAELYVEFGLAIKQRSPAQATLIAELSDGAIGYVPTPEAIRHGGYSAASSRNTRLIAEAGWMMVDSTVEMLGKVFDHHEQ